MAGSENERESTVIADGPSVDAREAPKFAESVVWSPEGRNGMDCVYRKGRGAWNAGPRGS